MVQITKDNAYDAAAPDDFPAMLDVERYGKRTTAFDKIISATHDHFWDPLDKKYIDFDAPFDTDAQTILPEEFFAIFATRIGDGMTRQQKVKFANQAARWQISSILHGEQGALALSASLCHILKDPGAQEYAANQTREEARHVTTPSPPISSRAGARRSLAAQRCRPCSPKLSAHRKSTRRSSACRCWSRAWPWAPSPRSIRRARTRSW